jgi:hypothetical protein
MNNIKIKLTAAPLPNDNTYILLSDNHGPRKSEITQQCSNSEASNDTTPPIERTYININQQKGETGSKIKTTHAPQTNVTTAGTTRRSFPQRKHYNGDR